VLSYKTTVASFVMILCSAACGSNGTGGTTSENATGGVAGTGGGTSYHTAGTGGAATRHTGETGGGASQHTGGADGGTSHYSGGAGGRTSHHTGGADGGASYHTGVTDGGGVDASALAARISGFRRGVNLDRWFLNPAPTYPRPPGSTSFITGEDLRLIRDLGFDHVRLLIHLEQVFVEGTPSQMDRDGLAELDAGIQLVLDHELNVVIDLHSTDPQHWERFSYRLENETGFIDAFATFWTAFAGHLTRYSPERLLLQPMNEPIFEGRPREWLPIQDQLVTAIRAAAPNHTIVAVTAEWQARSLLLELEPLADKNVVYDFHYYEPSSFIFQGYFRNAVSGWELGVAQSRGLPYPVVPEVVDSLAARAASPYAAGMIREYGSGGWNAAKHSSHIAAVREWANRHDVPVICTEFGVDSVFMTKADQLNYVRDVRQALDENAIGWSFYDYEQGYGIVRRGEAGIVLDAPLVEALGLDPSTVNGPKYTLPLSPTPLGSCSQGAVDDLEDGNGSILALGGRSGQWQVIVDSVGSSVTPTTFAARAGGAQGSSYAANVSGKIGVAQSQDDDRYYGLEAGMGFALDTPFDASAAQGLSFWAKGEGVVDVTLRDGNSSGDDPPYFVPVRLTDDWTQYTILFSGLQQTPYWGTPHGVFEPSTFRSVAWLNSTPGKEFDIWIDGVELVGCP